MTKRIYGGLDVTHNVTAKGNRTVQSIYGTPFDENGNMELDGYTDEELQEIISVLPLSHYGTHNYLPAGVSGDFVGASENLDRRAIKLFLEDDGTLVFLRSGTNGSSIGVYYSYLANGLNTTNLNSTVNSNKEYRPGYMPSNLYAFGTVPSDSNIVCGYMMDRNTNTQSGLVFTSLTKGTLDENQHIGYMINQSTLCPTGGVLKYVFQGSDGYIYYISYMRNNTGNPLDLTIVRVLYNQSTGTTTATEISGWNGNLFCVQPANNRTIRIADNAFSDIPANRPYMLVPSGLNAQEPFMVDVDIAAAQNPVTNEIRIRMNGDAWATTATYNTRPQHGFSFRVNITTKTIVLDPEYQSTPASLVITDTGSSLVPSGNIVQSDSIYMHFSDANLTNTYQYLPKLNSVLCVSTPNLGRPPLIQRAKVQSNLDEYDLMNWKRRPTVASAYGFMYQTYGSVITNNVFGLELLPNNTTKQSVITGTGGGMRTYAQHGSTANYPFHSLAVGDIVGYEPTVGRGEIYYSDDSCSFISTVQGNNVTTNGGIFIESRRLSTPYSYNDVGVGSSQRITIDGTAFTNFKNSEFSKVSTPLLSTAEKSAVLYCPQQTDIPAMVLLTAVTPQRGYYARYVEVNVNTRSGNITSISFKRLITEYTDDGSNYVPTTDASFRLNSPGITIYDAGSFYFIGGADPLIRRTVGNDLSYSWSAIIEKSTQQYSRLRSRGGWSSNSMGTFPFALPNIGFGFAQSVDYLTRIIFYKIGTTIAEYDAWTIQGAPTNVVSQEVAKGFILYFTENTPVMLSGKSFTMPIQSIDLTTIKENPANTTFHVYVRMEQGVARYFITENVIAETGTVAYNILWIGTVVTNMNQIASVNIIKRSRLDVFGESHEAAGSSFPVSYGMPSGSGTINW